MTSGLPAGQPIPRPAGASGAVPALAPPQPGAAAKCAGGRPAAPPPPGHRQFWLDVGRAAAQHTCQIRMARARDVACGASEGEASTSGRDLLVVGPGVLGGLVGKLWRDAHPESRVVGQTNTDANHARLQRLGLTPRVKQGAPREQFPSVLFAAPPSGSTDYVGEVRDSLALWSGEGSFVFTSSSAAYDTRGMAEITEATPSQAPGASERVDRLLASERAVLDAGGCVVRLVGLYHARRGAHTFFLRQGEVPRWGGHVVNLVHYEDAAALVLKVLQGAGSAGGRHSGRVFLGTDSHPLTFQEMMDATLASGQFGSGAVRFTGPAEATPAPGSSNAATARELGWQPRYPSFQTFMANGATDFYSQFE